jgi:hypothetical protein
MPRPSASLRLVQHEVADERENGVGLLDSEHVACPWEADGARVLRWKRGREFFRVLDRDAWVELAGELEDGAADLSKPRSEVESEQSPRKKCCETSSRPL